MKSRQLPGFCVSQRKLAPKGIVIHYFSCKNVDGSKSFDLAACWNLMVDLNRPKVDREHYLLDERSSKGRVYASAHLFIGRKGEAWKLIDFDRRGYHAGVSSLNGVTGCNQWTIGIELIGSIDSGFTDEQYCALAKLCKTFMKKYDFDIDSIAGHDQVRYEAILNGKKSSFKCDPSGTKDGQGSNFDWDKLTRFIDLF